MAPDRSPDRADDSPGERSLDPDATFDALADGRRRRAVRTLRAADGALTIEGLARRIVARETETDLASVPSDEVHRVAARLYHADLPKLEAAALIDYDERAREVRPLVDWSALPDALASALESEKG